MTTIRCPSSVVVCAALTSVGLGQQHLVVPSSCETSEGMGQFHVAGVGQDVRQQILVGASHLTGLVGRSISALEFRRNGDATAFGGGVANITMSLSITGLQPLQCSQSFAANVGPTPVQVFSGQVAIPASSGIGTGPASWSANQVVRIGFSTPFAYTGGTLCVEIVGSPVVGQVAGWWAADACAENLSGVTVDLGGGCGPYGGAQHRWSFVTPRSLLPGAYAQFSAHGTPGWFGVLAIGDGSPIGVPLSITGLNAAAGCNIHLASLLGLEVVQFPAAASADDSAFGTRGVVELKLPGTTAAFGIHLATQWVDLATMSTSNAIDWTIAQSVPTIDMAVVDGHPLEPVGDVSVRRAHVLRFEHD